MQYGAGERDMLLMKHTFIAEYPEGKKEKITCTLIDYGLPNGDSSMARTVSLPVAISIRLVLEGKFTTPGLQIPIIKELYEPILQELEALEPSIKVRASLIFLVLFLSLMRPWQLTRCVGAVRSPQGSPVKCCRARNCTVCAINKAMTLSLYVHWVASAFSARRLHLRRHLHLREGSPGHRRRRRHRR